MKLIRLLTFASALATCLCGSAAWDLKQMVEDCPEKAGGIYYAYDVKVDSVAPAPAGYQPVYISHYGRHGSRWPVNQKIYKTAGDFFQEQQLAENITPEGKTVWKMVTSCAGNAVGHLGELTGKGERQHRAIASRLLNRFPGLFSGNKVVGRSSVEPRCIMSMMAFFDELEERVPGLAVSKHATPGDMDFIHHNTPEAKLNTGEEAPWMWDFSSYRDSVSLCRKTAARLFKKVPECDSLPIFMRSLYDVAISVQDIDSLDVDLLSVFDGEELAGLWKAANYMQYVANGKSPQSMSSGPESVKPLLREIVGRAEEMLSSGDVAADFRFGHDTDLLRLVSLIDARGVGVELEDADIVADHWRNFEISPMGANVQLVFYRNSEGKIIVMPRLNEVPVKISDVPETFPGYYDWEILKSYFNSLL